jgi:hypothetical protein|tara:strand:- start:1144 stop:1494 length:351 start_codon:yes stop_codon:yes gene_type:complete
MVSIKDEIDIVINQANSFIDYKNKNKPYDQFVHEYMTFADRSSLKQDFKYLQTWLMNVQNADPDQFLEEILNFEGLMSVINEQTKDDGGVSREQYNWAQTYYQEKQNDLRPQSYHQ